jgi:hypothetical protein
MLHCLGSERRGRLLFSLCFVFSVSLCLCGWVQGAEKKAGKVTYQEHVLPLLREKCLSCHNTDKKRAGLDLSNHTALMQGSSGGPVVKPGDPEESQLYKAVAHKEEPFMPPRSPKLPDEFVETIRRWIELGAPENAGSKVVLNKPKIDIALPTASLGKPEGPPPMPTKAVSLEPVVRTARANAVVALATSPWAPLIAVGGQKQVLLYNSDTLELVGVLPFPEGMPYVVKFSRNGSLVLAGGGVGGKSGKVVVWSVKTGERIFAVGEETDVVLAADISSDQTRIALGGPGKVVRIYSTRDGKLLHEIRKHTDWVTALEFSPDGVLLATGDRNGGLHVWEAFTAREFYTLAGHKGMITDISWRADSNVFASASEDASVRLWEMQNGKQVRSWGAHGGGTQSVRFTHDGRLVTAGRDKRAKAWAGDGKALRSFEPFADLALQATFSHDGKRVFAGDWTGTVRVWDAANGKRLGEFAPNPPTLSERLSSAKTAVEAKKKEYAQLAAVATSSKAAADKIAADLAAAKKAVGETAKAAQAAQATVKQVEAAVTQAKATLTAAQAEARALAVYAAALAEASAKVKAEADKAKGDAALAAVAKRAQTSADEAAREANQKQDAAMQAAVVAKAAEAKLATNQKNVQATQAAAAEAPKRVAALTAALKPAQAKATADAAKANQAKAALAEAEAAVTRWTSALTKKDQ